LIGPFGSLLIGLPTLILHGNYFDPIHTHIDNTFGENMLPTNEKIKESFAEGLTQSEMMERCNCPRKHMFRYILGLKRQGSFSWSLLVGGGVHKLLERHYKLMKETGQGLTEPKTEEFELEPDVVLTPDQWEEYHYWQIVAGMLVYRHNRYWEEMDRSLNIQQVEVPVDLQYNGFRLRGMIDLVATGLGKGDRPWIMDHKTASDISDLRLEGWQFRFQFLFYSWLWKQLTGERPAGNYVNILKKPQERRSIKKAESIENFCKRIDWNIQARPEDFFRREWIPLDDGMIERFERYTLNPVLTQFRMIKACTKDPMSQEIKEAMLLSPNTDHCTFWNVRCEFLDLCKDDFKELAVEYIPRHAKHPELLHLTDVNL
jgi:PD-(D/E)XK nuclease superfamily protein